jgi:hypothetical protein
LKQSQDQNIKYIRQNWSHAKFYSTAAKQNLSAPSCVGSGGKPPGLDPDLNRGHTSYMAGCTRVLPTRLREGFLHLSQGARTYEPIFLSLQQPPPLSITSKFHSILPLRLKIGSPFDHRHHRCERHNDSREVYLVHT